MGPVSGEKKAPVKKESRPTKNDLEILGVVDEPVHEVCRRLRKAGLVREFRYGDRFFLANDLEFESVESGWIIYPNAETAERHPDIVISCSERGVWLPSVDEAFQIIREHGFNLVACSTTTSFPFYGIRFTKLARNPTTKLVGVVYKKSHDLRVATLRVLEDVITGNYSEKWRH